MPFFSTSRKRRKFEEAQAAPVYPSNPPPYVLNTSTSVYQQPPHQWTPQADLYLAPPSQPYMTTLSLPATQYVQPEYTMQPLQPQHTWSHPQPSYAATARPTMPTVLREKIDDKLSDVISLIDEDAFSGSERELMITLGDESATPDYTETRDLARALGGNGKAQSRQKKQAAEQRQLNVFTKLDLYMNSRLPAALPPFRVYMPTWPLLCLAAQYSNNAYLSPQSSHERNDFVSADGRIGTKAMVIKSIPCDDKKTIVFAIRGTSMFSVRDWGVNLSTEPVSPAGFLDDQGNLCHAGFLRVAKAMVRPIAARLRHLLEENPSRSSCSLLITGHSAGGAVASLLYAHMLSMSESVQSELNILTGCFKRVHCVTFGAPPVSLLPLQKPDTADGRLRKCLFHSFINEGDPVVRAEKAYIKSLVDLLSRPIPSLPSVQQKPSISALASLGASMSRLDLALTPATKRPKASGPKTLKSKHSGIPLRKLWWDVPPATLSNAGRLVVLRVPDGARAGVREAEVTASLVKDDQLRQVIFGDPLVHSMALYAERIELLAVRAVTGRGGAC